jgi:hypothetical protein
VVTGAEVVVGGAGVVGAARRVVGGAGCVRGAVDVTATTVLLFGDPAGRAVTAGATVEGAGVDWMADEVADGAGSWTATVWSGPFCSPRSVT